MKALVATALLAVLAACSSGGVDSVTKPASHPATGKPLPFAPPPPPMPDEGVVCAQDAKLCADGSYVSRTAPGCAFTTCPGEATNKSGEAVK